MIKEALEYIVKIDSVAVSEINGSQYATGQLIRIPQELTAATLPVHTLTAIVDYITSGADESAEDEESINRRFVLHVADFDRVNLYRELNSDKARECLLEAKLSAPTFPFGRWMDVETFIINMQTHFVQDENHSVLVSSHITSDLEKVADYITFIHKGKLIFSHEKDELIDNYGILNCGAAIFDVLDKSEIVAYRKEDYQFKVLVKDRNKAAKQYPNAIVGPATIEEIMLFYVKGEMK